MILANWWSENLSLVKEWARTNTMHHFDVSRGSDKKVGWECSKGHVWKTTVLSRINGSGCPYCSGRMATESTCLQTRRPDIATEWDYIKNGAKTPRNTTWKSNKKVWWKCVHGHEWETSVANRTNGGTGCPYCAGKKATLDTSLLAQFPVLVKEWHSDNVVKPEDVLPKSHQKIFWLCPNGHKYCATVASRTHMQSGCPFCAWSTSKLELRIYCELKSLLSGVLLRDKSLGFEIDIFLTEQKIGIEVDGGYWHKDRVAYDQAKSGKMMALGYRSIRVREFPLPIIGEYDIVSKRGDGQRHQHSVVWTLVNKVSLLSGNKLSYDKKVWLNEKEFHDVLRSQALLHRDASGIMTMRGDE